MANIAIMGFGTVGSGVAEVVHTNQDSIRRRTLEPVTVKYILDTRDFPNSTYGHLVIHDFSIIEQDPEIQVVVECIGGCGVALDFTRRALLAGKDVVTSNKALVAAHGLELLALAKEQGRNFLFEASVGGGIPVLRPLAFCLAGNRIEEICGILNGTTNYILTKMIRDGEQFDDVLKRAQEKGYAEADPTDDVEGKDACRKICILAALAYGIHVYPEQVYTCGITGIRPQDVACADALGMQIKLFGRTFLTEEGKIALYVSPHLIPNDKPLASVEGVFNAIMIRGNAVGETMFYGRGAGKLPTASAVVGDVVDCILHREKRRAIDWEAGSGEKVVPFESLELRWLVRTEAAAGAVAAALGPVEAVPGQNGAYVTGPVSKAKLDELREKGFSILSAIPVLD